MIETRMHKARRLLEVNRGLQRLEESRIAALQGRQAELASLQEELLGVLNKDEAAQDLMVNAVVRRLSSLNEEAASIAEELERRMLALQAHAGQAKCAERRFRAYEQEHEKSRAQKELLDVIERAIRAGDASLP